jgi:plasmid stabilization system protein ParE
MRLRLTPRALLEAKRIKTWWQAHRRAAPDLFEQELEAALGLLVTTPTLGTVYAEAELDVPVRRVLLKKTRNHVYFAVQAEEVVILSVWGAPRRRGPKL